MIHVCKVPGCDNEVHPQRVNLGLFTCIELHAEQAKSYTVIPVPKSNGVVGRKEDLIGISSSHKGTSPSALGSTEWWRHTTFSSEVKVHHRVERPVANNSVRVLQMIKGAKRNVVGYQVYGDLALAIAYRNGWTSSDTEPAWLTKKGIELHERLVYGSLTIDALDIVK